MDKRFWGFLIAVALILSVVFFMSQSDKADAPGSSSSTAKGTLTSHTQGSSKSGVRLLEYGDFQCPACGEYELAAEEVVAKYGDRIIFQFRNFPLYQIHPNAIASARAAEAADLQGQYWKMHNLIYRNQSDWTPSSDAEKIFDGYATNLGLNLAKFQQDYKSSAVNDRIQADLAEGNKLGVDSTPTFFMDNKKINTPAPTIEAFSKILDAELAKKGAASTNDNPTPAQATTPQSTPTGQ